MSACHGVKADVAGTTLVFVLRYRMLAEPKRAMIVCQVYSVCIALLSGGGHEMYGQWVFHDWIWICCFLGRTCCVAGAIPA